MRGRRFESLLSRLEARGVPRAMSRRIGAELTDHFDLLVEEELARSADEATVRERAAARLGSQEQLYEQFLSDPRIVPLMKRRPVAAFVLAPIPMIALLMAAYGLVAISLVKVMRLTLGIDVRDPVFAVIAMALFVPAAYGLITATAWWFCRAARAAECPQRWPLTACALLAAFGGLLSLGYVLPDQAAGAGSLFAGVSSAINWPRVVLPLAVFVAFAAVNRWPVRMRHQ